MTAPAIRTVSEDDDVHVIEGLIAFGGQQNGRDSYGTLFSARTDFGFDLHPEGIPLLYDHGFDPDFGMKPIGRTMPTSTFRTDESGVWLQAQVDKHHKYYESRIRPALLNGGADGTGLLGLSQGSAEHSVNIDMRTGDVMSWPTHEISLTPTRSNWFSLMAARSGETIRIVAALAEPESAGDDPKPAVRSGGDAATAAMAMQTILLLSDSEAGEADQVAMLDKAVAALQEFITAEMAEPQPDADAPADADDMPGMAYMSAVRLGKRNSESDQTHIDAIHQHVTALGASAHTGDEAQGDDDSGDSEAEAARSGEPVPTIRIVEPADPDAERRDLADFASTVALAAVRSFRGEVG